MVKANGYGTDNLLVAKEVEEKVDYFGVAFATNGYELRKNGIVAPIFVMAATPKDLTKLAQENLEPVLYSIEMVKAAIALKKHIKVHLEIDAGMKRLGLHEEEIPEVISLINSSNIEVISAFAHVAAPAESVHDKFTHQQAAYFNTCFKQLALNLNTNPFKHLMPTGGISRFANYQFDMVRLGIGVYGYDSSNLINDILKPVATLQAKILQILDVKKGESVGYSRMGALPTEGKIATLSIGYGDGYLRINGNENAEVFINNKRAKTVGNICMDLMMVDVTNIKCNVGDLVELFGPNITIRELARVSDTIPYEILTNISPRVERILVD